MRYYILAASHFTRFNQCTIEFYRNQRIQKEIQNKIQGSSYLETYYSNHFPINIGDEINEINDFILNDLGYLLINWYVKINNYDKLIWMNNNFVFFKEYFKIHWRKLLQNSHFFSEEMIVKCSWTEEGKI